MSSSARWQSGAPRYHIAPDWADSFGPEAGKLVAAYGLRPDPWQQPVLDDWLAVGDDGRWACLTCALSMPRQNGKNALLEMREVFGVVGRGEKILHTAHQVKTARKHFKRLQMFFGVCPNDPAALYPELNSLVKEIRNVNGQEALYFHNGASVEILARSKQSGRGFTVDVLVFDEAQEMSDDDLEAQMPATSSAPLGNPQWIFTGTAPGPNVNSAVFMRTRSKSVDGNPNRTCWHEWSCEPDADPDDRDVWRETNPALDSGRLLLEVIEGERDRFSDQGFMRERLGLWPSMAVSLNVFPLPLWAQLAEPGPPDGTEPVSMSVDMSHDRAAVVAACWDMGERRHVELVVLDYVRSDTTQVVDWVAQRAGRRIPVVIDSASPASSMVPALKARKVKVVQTGAGDMVKACGVVYDEVMSRRLTHADQEQLNLAVEGAKRRPIRDAGGWGWDRRDPNVNIAPLVAVTLAVFGSVGSKQARKVDARGRTGRSRSSGRVATVS